MLQVLRTRGSLFFVVVFIYTSCANRAQLATVWITGDTCTVCGHPTTTNWECMCTVCGPPLLRIGSTCVLFVATPLLQIGSTCVLFPTTTNWEYTCVLFVVSGNYFTMYKIGAVLAFAYHSSCHCYYFVYMYCL